MPSTIIIATIDYASDYSDYAPARLVRVGVLASPGPAPPPSCPRPAAPAPGPGSRRPSAYIENSPVCALYGLFMLSWCIYTTIT